MSLVGLMSGGTLIPAGWAAGLSEVGSSVLPRDGASLAVPRMKMPIVQYDDVGGPSRPFSLDGLRVGWDHVPPTFSPDGAHVAYAAQRGGKWLVVADRQDGKEYDEVPGDDAARSGSSWWTATRAESTTTSWDARLV